MFWKAQDLFTGEWLGLLRVFAISPKPNTLSTTTPNKHPTTTDHSTLIDGQHSTDSREQVYVGKMISETDNIASDKIPCPYSGYGCPSTFLDQKNKNVHVNKFHHHVKCGTCEEIMNELTFKREHSKLNSPCYPPTGTPWNKQENTPATWTLNIPKKPFACTYGPGLCNSSFDTPRFLQMHIYKYHRHLKCPNCELVLSLRSFKLHQQRSADCVNATGILWDKINNCGVVRKAKTSQTSDKIPCIYCKSTFCDQNYMRRHVRMIHHHIKCAKCEEIVTEFNFKREHTKINSPCPEAEGTPWNKGENTPGTWNRNWSKKVKTNLPMPHVCTFAPGKCNSSFSKRRQLQAHVSNFHRYFKCQICKIVITAAAVKKHKERSAMCSQATCIPWDKMKNCQKIGKSSCKHADEKVASIHANNDASSSFFKTRTRIHKKYNKWYSQLGNTQLHLSCEIFSCSFVTAYPKNLRRHYETLHSNLITDWAVAFDSHKDSIEECPETGCGFKTNSDKLLQAHKQRHLQSFSFLCGLCRQLFKTKDCVKEHMMEIHKIFEHQHHLFDYRYKLSRSLKFNAGKVRCDVCGEQVTPSLLEQHRHRMHPPECLDGECQFPPDGSNGDSKLETMIDGKLVLECESESCDFKTYSFVALREHALTHQQFKTQATGWINGIGSMANASLKCKIAKCGYMTASTTGFRTHDKNHREGYTAKCVLCYQLFEDLDQLISHGNKVHSIAANAKALYYDSNQYDDIIRLYQCKVDSCSDFMTCVRATWERHLVWHLNHTQGTFSCKLCSMPLGSGRDLRRHFESSHRGADMGIKQVTVPTNLTCCGEQFTAAVLYILHQRLFHPQNVASKVDEVYPEYYKKQKIFL